MKEKMKKHLKDYAQLFCAWVREDKRRALIVVVAVLLFFGYGISRNEEKTRYIYEGANDKFTQAHVVENPYKHLAENKIEIVEETQERLRQDNRDMQRQLADMKKTLEEVKTGITNREPQGGKDTDVKRRND